MRKLKLQMQITIDGFVASPDSKLDWMTADMKDEKLLDVLIKMVDTSETLLMGRKMTDEFIDYWTSVKPDSHEYEFAQKLVKIPKIVFSRTMTESPWVNTTIRKHLIPEIAALKQQDGKDILVYGGAGLVTALINERLFDEYNFFVNSVAIGKGMTIFGDVENNFNLSPVNSQSFDCGVVLNCYEPQGLKD